MRTALAIGVAAMLSSQTAVATLDDKLPCSGIKLFDTLKPYLTVDGLVDQRYLVQTFVGYRKFVDPDGIANDDMVLVRTFSLPSIGEVIAFHKVDIKNTTGAAIRHGDRSYFPTFYFPSLIRFNGIYYTNPTGGINGDEIPEEWGIKDCR